MRKSRGFTLIEMIVIVIVLMLIAASIVPNLAAFTEGQRQRAYLLDVRSLAMDARETAIQSGRTALVRYEDGAGFVLERVESDATNERTEVRRVSKSNAPVPDRFISGGTERGAGDWELLYYPDGSSIGGGVHFDLGGDGISVAVEPKTGRTTLENGAIPDFTGETWPAGDYERRT